jgi:uncharacterized membrane protein HdeD (DUF308 family)
MIQALSNNWWFFLVRGIAALIVAALAVAAPGAMLDALVFVLGIYAFVGGVFAFAAALSGVAGDRWWAALLEGLIGMAAAFVIWFMPGTSTTAFVYVFAGWAILTGILQIVAGIQLRDLIGNEVLYILSGLVSLAFGIWVMRSPQQGALAEVYLVGAYALFFGIAQIVFSVRLRSLRDFTKKVTA